MSPEDQFGADAGAGVNESASPTQAMDPDETAGTVIGRYRLLQKIGEGGMGEVWLAEQKEPVRRRVALKLVKAGMNTREVIARFESERQALALMDHPAIAKVFDAGSTPQGAPYFVMEYVAGVPITTYCDNHRLSTRERLELFMHVCEGVQHAHQKAIIHRDLKPSNILVTEVDGRPAPKIIDFGVAKALTQKLTADTMFTRVGALVGTPEYMSPEQAISSGEDIDTRTDVYSLGHHSLRVAGGGAAARAAKNRLRRIPAQVAGGRTAEAEHQDPHAGPRHVDGSGSQAPDRAAGAGQTDARRSGFDRAEGSRKGPLAPLRFALRFRRGYWAVPEERSGAGSPAFGGLPRPQVRAPLPRGAGHRLRLRAGADRGRRHQHPAEHTREPGSGRGPGGQRFPAERSAGAGQRQPTSRDRAPSPIRT